MAHCNISYKQKSCAIHRGCRDYRHHKTPLSKGILAWGREQELHQDDTGLQRLHSEW